MKSIVLWALVLLCSSLCGQQAVQLPNHLQNQNIYNPGAVGTSETDMNIGLVSRFQFINLNGAPRLYEGWGDVKLKSLLSALGVNIKRETAGATELNDMSLTYAYKLFLSKKINLSMGLRLGYMFGKFNTTRLDHVFDPDDPLMGDANQINSFKVGLGFKLYTDRYFVSLASPDLYAPGYRYALSNDSAKAQESFFTHARNLILTSSYKLPIGDLYYLQPSLLLQVVPRYGMKMEPTLNFGLNNYFWFGAGYSNMSYLTFNAGAQISPKMKFAYIYELPFTSKVGNNVGFSSHSINLLIFMDGFSK
ncbi:MAG TPA: PorP/SprF family type IX secretion system membrane protein [Cytophagales bacterium]|nr:PorP/SprF family type IX secretion system membrane protein [Cytophagales bacterium]